jgi:hypothetical protein
VSTRPGSRVGSGRGSPRGRRTSAQRAASDQGPERAAGQQEDDHRDHQSSHFGTSVERRVSAPTVGGGCLQDCGSRRAKPVRSHCDRQEPAEMGGPSQGGMVVTRRTPVSQPQCTTRLMQRSCKVPPAPPLHHVRAA